MAKDLKMVSVSDEDGHVCINMQGASGRDFKLRLSVFDVSSLVSALYAARAEVFKSPPDNAPEVLLRLQGLNFGEDDNHVLMRAFVTDRIFHDYAAEKGTPLATVLDSISHALAIALNQEPEEFGNPGPRQ